MSSYIVEYGHGGSVEIEHQGLVWSLHRVPYSSMKTVINQVKLQSDNIVYLLSGKDDNGKDNLYVGMSSDGLRTRPIGHKDKEIPWDYCYYLDVRNPNAVNGGMAEYIEYRLAHLIMDSKSYVSQTERVSDKKASPKEKAFCKEMILPFMIEILDILGIHLKEQMMADITDYSQPETNLVSTGSAVAQDYRVLKMGATIDGWLEIMEQMVKAICPSVETIVKEDSMYVAFKKGKRTAIRCYPKKDGPRIDIFFYGQPEAYSDSRIVPRPENRHDKPLDSMFVIRGDEDLKYFQLFAQKAINSL